MGDKMLFIFDMGGVVTTTFFHSGKNRFFEKLGVTADEFNNFAAKADLHALDVGQISVKQFWKNYNEIIERERPELPRAENDLFRLYFHPKLNQGTVDLIRDLSKNHRVVCGTNTIDSHWENHCERGDYSYFDQTYASNKIGVAKPNPEFWQTIMMAEGYEPGETFFTDDRLDNIEAASALGINAVQFTTAEELRKAWGKYII